MKEKYGVEIYYQRARFNGTIDPGVYKIVWYDTLEEAIKHSGGEPIIKSIAYRVVEKD